MGSVLGVAEGTTVFWLSVAEEDAVGSGSAFRAHDISVNSDKRIKKTGMSRLI